MGRKGERAAFMAALAGGRSPLTTPYEQALAEKSSDDPLQDLEQWAGRAGRLKHQAEREKERHEREKARSDTRNQAASWHGQGAGTAKPGKGKGRGAAKPGKGKGRGKSGGKPAGTGKNPYGMGPIPRTAADDIRDENKRPSGSGSGSSGGGDVSLEARDERGQWTKAEVAKYSEAQARDEHGRWTAEDGGSAFLNAQGQPRVGAEAVHVANSWRRSIGGESYPISHETIMAQERHNIEQWHVERNRQPETEADRLAREEEQDHPRNPAEEERFQQQAEADARAYRRETNAIAGESGPDRQLGGMHRGVG